MAIINTETIQRNHDGGDKFNFLLHNVLLWGGMLLAVPNSSLLGKIISGQVNEIALRTTQLESKETPVAIHEYIFL